MNEIEELIEERKKLVAKIKDRERFLKKQRLTCFLSIWLGYAVIIFGVWINIEKHEDVTSCLLIALPSLFIALFCFIINAAVWSNFTLKINYTVEYLKQLNKELDEIDNKSMR